MKVIFIIVTLSIMKIKNGNKWNKTISNKNKEKMRKYENMMKNVCDIIENNKNNVGIDKK